MEKKKSNDRNGKLKLLLYGTSLGMTSCFYYFVDTLHSCFSRYHSSDANDLDEYNLGSVLAKNSGQFVKNGQVQYSLFAEHYWQQIFLASM